MQLEWVDRPWGRYTNIYSGNNVTVKLLKIWPQEAISLQYHQLRDEYWVLVGSPHLDNWPAISIGYNVMTMKPGARYYVPRLHHHRIINPGSSPVNILEVAVGEFDENDIVRLEDKYGRH